MKPTKGLSQDQGKLEQPPGSYPFGKNGVWRKGKLTNEKGFRQAIAQLPYTYIGSIQTDGDPIIFSTDNTFSAIGIYNQDSDTYIPKVDDKTLPYKLGFRTDKPIIGESRRDYKGSLEVAWLDKHNPIRFANLDSIPDSLDNYLIFPKSVAADISLSVVSGGLLAMGAYYAATRYRNEDGTLTRYSTLSPPIFATADNFAVVPGFSTGKSLKVLLENVDQRYSYVQVVIVSRINGVTSAIELPEISTVNSTATVTYNGIGGTPTTLEEVIIPAGFYDNADSMTQLNDILYLAGMKESAILNLQKYANRVQLRWKSEFYSDIDGQDDIKSGKVRTFKHGEVIAGYIVYYLDNGTITNAFTVPGVAPSADDLTNDPLATAQGLTAKKYQVNTVGMTGIDTIGQTGKTGVWVNTNELYPDLPEFDSREIGGEDYRGKQVRHHKLPTLNQTLNYFYKDEPTFGVSGIDALGLLAENVIIPPELIGTVVGYELFYAQRDYSSATILSQAMPLYGSKSNYTGNDQYFVGGNFNSGVRRTSGDSSDSGNNSRNFKISGEVFKLEHPDLLVNKPTVAPSFLSKNYKLSVPIGSPFTNTEDEMNFFADYRGQGSRIDNQFGIRGVKNTSYLITNGIKNQIKNTKSEDGFVGEFTVPAIDISVGTLVRNARNTTGDGPTAPAFEEGWLVDVVVIREDVYSPFNTQELVRSGVVNKPDLRSIQKYSFAGDTFISWYSFFTYGPTSSIDRYPSNPGRKDGVHDSDGDKTYSDEFYRGGSGVHVIRRYVAESNMNLWQRYVDPGIETSKFWPASPAETANNMDRNRNQNTIAINVDANSIGNLLNGIKVYDYKQINIPASPNKIVRSSKQAREGRLNSWKNYNALDYYETERNMGIIVNLQGWDDRLIIHHKNALYITQDKTTLQGDILSVTLGSGDIFRFPPKPGRASKVGYAGTQHQLACVLTDFGYVFPDAETGEWFVLSSEGLIELNMDLSNLFNKYLKIDGINPYVGNGITIGYDYEYKRLLFTVKNTRLLDLKNFVPNYEETTEFFAKLIPYRSVVYKDGRYQLFMGGNTSSYSCSVYIKPVLPANLSFSINEFSPAGSIVGIVRASGNQPITYAIVAGNDANAFAIDSKTGTLVVLTSTALDIAARENFSLSIRAINNKGDFDTKTVLVDLIPVSLAPVTGNYEVDITEGIPPGYLITKVQATDPRGLPLTWTLVAVSVPGSLMIQPSGDVRVVDATMFNFDVNQVITAQFRVSNGDTSSIANLRININNL